MVAISATSGHFDALTATHLRDWRFEDRVEAMAGDGQ